uniref:NADH dehydrogenase [ubiquinone] 1 alpha subcomplex subunit 5 n=1 Tax=Trieres chinensis TaxID=1514140 RepID=A0A7S2A2A3_TRICV|mmetsp:Transcript_38170/g.77896  ORF Transcript_38170/g.77896 Transcript_38170/m.77896 type:complete len:181 (+) Transcript_38170:53-595(+)|eukprot:CAMPEP_0183307626 /NCGR_PEP_ID=MMETSP0160_2-20130417/18390_1 /TAXON_ID=2839 ORGANISM="Odontella Sinensis, Strain Grunow 1884" /NCGR_SAMPLE_ID=MMETSP0160_2 /ASSEMBLY_ACC=CAM_ASM_000250 /LENGTH=180 /DNA_ID=CAMNT_0025471249 /DNA_START=52 /DNA_END=594 /DNA_ORIENTATION=+
MTSPLFAIAARGIARASARRATIAYPAISFRSFSAETELIPGVGRGKTSTGLVGIPVDYDAVPKMIVKYQAILDKMAASDMPPDCRYAVDVTKICNYRIKAAKENLDDPEKVEELCNCGQVEELVIQADEEMMVLDMYLKNRWWEFVKDTPIEYNPNPMEEDDIEYDSPLEKNEEYKDKE